MASPPTCSTSTAADGTALPATGFLGAIVGGVLAGLIAHWIASWRVPTWARGLMPVMVIPLLTSIIAGFIMIVVLGKPIYWVMTELNRGLNNMSGSSAILLGMILGLMMAFDMGGPLNKVAYVFATAGIGVASLAADAPAAEDHGLGDARRHGAPDRARPGHRAPARTCSPSPSARTARPAGCSARRSSPRARSRSPRPTRCA